MRHPVLLAFTMIAALGFSSFEMAQAQSNEIGARNVRRQAQVVKNKKPQRARSDVVVITPRYLTAGTRVGPGETRNSVLNADAQYRSTGRDISGYDLANLRRDPFYLPYPQSSLTFDSPWGRKSPNEN